MLTTYHVERPLLRYPVDHVFLSPGVRVGRLERRVIPGSDHFAVIGTFDIAKSVRATPDPAGSDRREALEMISDGRADAEERGAAPNHE